MGITELVLSNAILDPLHGLVRLTKEELDLIDRPIFRRLRGTKQNGLLWLVFPSATHTRFEHSLGALFVADTMWHALLSNSKVASLKTPPRVRLVDRATSRQAVDLTSVDPGLRARLYRIIRLGALAHDLGHGPLSHTFDHFAPTRADLRRLFRDPRLESLRLVENQLLVHGNEAPGDHVRIEHEVMSCVFFALCWNELHGNQDLDVPLAIAAAILGPDLYDGVQDASLRAWIPLAHDIIASAPADADRMDYLERDSKSFGVTYGLFDRNRLLKSLLCYLSEGPIPEYRLGIKRSGLRAVENLVQARFELFVQVYYHKTNRAIELMLNEIAREADLAKVNVLSTDTLDRLVQSYIDLDDHQFLRRLQAGDSPRVASLVSDIQNRRLWKRVVDVPAILTRDRVDASKTLASGKALEAQLKALVLDNDLHVDQVPPKATKDLDGGAALLRRDDDGVYAALKSETWPQASAIIRTLGLEDKAVVRIYLKSSVAERLRVVRSALQTVSQTRPEIASE